MKKIFNAELCLPLFLLVLGVTLPTGFVKLAPQYLLFSDDLFYWYATVITISGSMAAVRMTFNRLIALNPHTNARIVSEVEEEGMAKNAMLKANSKTAQLIIMGTALISLLTDIPPTDFSSMMLFTSLRMGEVLFLLGGIVMATAHFKMRKL
jgi:hypothetical protein